MIFNKPEKIQFLGAVVSELESIEKFSAIKELIQRAPIFKNIKNQDEFIEAVYEREREKTTGFGHGVAVAHGKITSVKTIKIGLGISRKGISYNSADGKPVRFLFLVASPPDKSRQYLKILSVLMFTMRSKNFRRELFSSNSSKEVETLLTKAFGKHKK